MRESLIVRTFESLPYCPMYLTALFTALSSLSKQLPVIASCYICPLSTYGYPRAQVLLNRHSFVWCAVCCVHLYAYGIACKKAQNLARYTNNVQHNEVPKCLQLTCNRKQITTPCSNVPAPNRIIMPPHFPLSLLLPFASH